MKCLFKLLFAFLIISNATAQKNPYLLVGTYSSPKSEGIYVYRFNSKTGEATLVSFCKSSNPSYLSVAPGNKTVYAVNENHPGAVSAYAFNKLNGTLTFLNSQPSNGDDPCYISTTKNGKFVIAGNYSSGSFSVYPVKKNFTLDTAIRVIYHKGSSVNKERQESAHVHSVVLSKDNHLLYVPDLGMDKVMIYSFNPLTGNIKEAPQPFIKVTDGEGPRHFEFHPNNKFAYLMTEMGGAVEVFSYGQNQLKPIQTISSHPDDFTGSKGSADIHVSPDGKFLYCSNRGESNTLTIFKIDQQTGKLSTIGYQSTLGKTPRNFNFDPSGNFILVANQNSDDIIIFKRDKVTGLLTDTGKRIFIGKPVCLKWIQ